MMPTPPDTNSKDKCASSPLLVVSSAPPVPLPPQRAGTDRGSQKSRRRAPARASARRHRGRRPRRRADNSGLPSRQANPNHSGMLQAGRVRFRTRRRRLGHAVSKAIAERSRRAVGPRLTTTKIGFFFRATAAVGSTLETCPLRPCSFASKVPCPATADN
jgi:hypothetical protein